MSTQNKPPITTALIAVNAAVFVAMVLTGVSAMQPTNSQLLKWGANWGPLSLGPQPWRALASNYLHVGILHIGLNMWCLWSLGALMERIFDRWTYLLTYTACGLAGSMASLWWHPLVVGAGASGAIFGLAGALIAALYLGHLPIPKEAVGATLKSLLGFAGYNLLFGAVGRGIDNSAHIGGLLCGLALGALMAKHLMASPDERQRWRSGVFLVALLALFAAFTLVKRANGYVVPLGRGITALESGRFEDAARALEDADRRKPNEPQTIFLLAGAYSQKQDYAKAEAAWQRVLGLNPEDAAAQFNLGLAQLKLAKYDQALVSLSKAVELNPQDPDAQQALGEVYRAKNMPDQARAAFQRSIELRKSTKTK